MIPLVRESIAFINYPARAIIIIPVIFKFAMQPRKAPLHPIQLLSFSPDKQLLLCPQAIRIFQSFQAPQLHIITVAGKYRTGKSYILNRVLLNQNSGFEVGPTINACTKGLWMWPQLVEIEVQGRVKKCVVVDTEGLGSLEEGENTDMKIFLMAVLLSSYLIYNSVGSIDEKAIENLSLVINLAELLHKNDNQYDSQELVNSFPSFMWLVRDFSLRLENEQGEPMTSEEYLEHALKYQNSASQAAERKNSIRKKLKTFFQERNCFTLIRPTQNEKDLQNLSTLPQKKLRPDFVRLISQFRQTVHRSLKPKKFRGKSVTPQAFIQLCKYFVDTINSGQLPSINSHWDNLCVKESSRIIEIYASEHMAKLAESYSEEDDYEDKYRKMEVRHRQILREANQKIEKSFLGKLEKQLSKERMEKVLSRVYEAAVRDVNESRYRAVKDIVKQIFEEILQEFNDSKLESFEEIFARFEQIKQNYKHDARIYESFYQNSKDVFQQFLRNLRNKWEHEQSRLTQKNDYLSHIIEEKTKQMQEKLERSNEQARQLKSRNYKLQLQNSQLQQLAEQIKLKVVALEEQKNALRQANQELEEYRFFYNQDEIERVRQQVAKELEIVRARLQAAEIEVAKGKEMYKQISIRERKLQREMQIFKNKCSEYLKQNIELNQKLDRCNKQLLQVEQNKRKSMLLKCNNTQEIPQFIAQLNTRVGQLEMKNKIKDQEIRNLQAMINSQKITQETLLKTPHNLNYSLLKKNYEVEKDLNATLQQKLKDYDFIHTLCSLKCLLCNKTFDKPSIKVHLQMCTQIRSVNFDVSYQYNGNGQIQFVIDINIDDQNWTIRKTMNNIRHLLKKMKINSALFDSNSDEDELSVNEQRRMYLDELFNQQRQSVLQNLFMIEYFSIDLHYLNTKKQKFRGSSIKSTRSSISLDSMLDQNMDANTHNIMMKTTRFNKKTFNFTNI